MFDYLACGLGYFDLDPIRSLFCDVRSSAKDTNNLFSDPLFHEGLQNGCIYIVSFFTY